MTLINFLICQLKLLKFWKSFKIIYIFQYFIYCLNYISFSNLNWIQTSSILHLLNLLFLVRVIAFVKKCEMLRKNFNGLFGFQSFKLAQWIPLMNSYHYLNNHIVSHNYLFNQRENHRNIHFLNSDLTQIYLLHLW